MSKPYYWWYVYGQFGPGEHNLPCLGEVVAYYLAFSGLSKEELARDLNWTERYIEMLKSSRNKDMPKILPRRILLAKALHIPPILLGLSSITLAEWSDGTPSAGVAPGTEVIASTETMQFYEKMLAVGWELYYTSNVQKAAESVDMSFHMLSTEFAHAMGVKKDQFDAMRCRFYQLFSLIERDRMNNEKSLEYENEAVVIASRLKNAELIASALLRRARIYIRLKEYVLALKDAETLLPYADLSRGPLKGKCYQMAGEAQGYLAGNTLALQEKSLAYFNKAAQIARKGNLEPDGSFVKTDLTSIYIEKAEALTSWKRYGEAHNTLAIARKNLSPELTRWEVNLLLAEASTYLAQDDVESCCHSLSEALGIARAISLPGKEERVYRLYELCKSNAPEHTAVSRLEKQLVS